MKADIKLAPKEVEQIIRDYIQQKFDHPVHGVRFDVVQEHDDRGQSMYPALREVVVSVELGSSYRMSR